MQGAARRAQRKRKRVCAEVCLGAGASDQSYWVGPHCPALQRLFRCTTTVPYAVAVHCLTATSASMTTLLSVGLGVQVHPAGADAAIHAGAALRKQEDKGMMASAAIGL